MGEDHKFLGILCITNTYLKSITVNKISLDDVTCWQCILQWTYISGLNWGTGPQTHDFYTDDCVNQSKTGCGPQETFRNCADICIGHE